MSYDIVSAQDYDDTLLIKLAREIARDIHPIDTIFTNLAVGADRWEQIRYIPYFQNLLQSQIEEWQSVSNTSERVKLKSLSFVEEVLPEFYARANDPREPLAAKTEILKTIARFAGIGVTQSDGAVMGERFTVTINLGADHTLKIEKDVTSKVIDHE